MRFKVFLRYLFLSFLILVVIFQAAFLVLPVLVETIILDPIIEKHLPQELPQGLTPSDLKFKIEKIGLTHTLVSRIQVGKVLSADLMDFQYGLKDLKRFALEKITVSGLTLYARVDADKNLRINGAIFPGKTKETPEGSGDTVDSPVVDSPVVNSPVVNINAFLDYLPKKMVLNKANLSITTVDRQILVPFEVLSSLDIDKKKAVLTARFYPFGQTVEAIIGGDLTSGIERIRIQATALRPEVLSGVLSGIFPEIKNYNLSGPVDIEIIKNIDTDWQLAVSQFKLDLPNLPGTIIKEFAVSAGARDGKITVVGDFDLAGSIVPAMGMHLDLNIAQKENAPFPFDVTLKNKPVKSLALATAPHATGAYGIGFDQPHLLFSLKGDLTRHTGDFFFGCQTLMVTKGKEEFRVKDIALKSVLSGEFSDQGKGYILDIQSELSPIKLSINMGQAQIMGQVMGQVMGQIMGLALDLKWQENKGGSPIFDLTLKNKKNTQLFLTSQSHKMRMKNPNLLLTLKGDLASQTGRFSFDSQNLRATQGKEQLLVKRLMVQSGIKGDFSDKGKGVEFDFKSNLSKIDVISSAAQAGAAGVTLAGNVGITKQFSSLVHLDARIIDGNVESTKFKTKALGINARLPLIFPYENENKPGDFSIQEIGYDDKFTASLGGSITQSELLGVTIGGKVSIDQLDGFNLGFKGRAGGGGPSDPSDLFGRIDFVIDPFLLKPVQMGNIMPKLIFGETSSIQLSSKGTIEYKHHGVTSEGSIMMDKGDLFFPDMNLSLTGVAGSIDFNDLMVPESLPGQVLTIDKITSGQFEFTHAKARFSIEDGQSVNIENLGFNWCNGWVSTESIRLPGRDNILSLTLFCDRLELSGLLKQMGAFHAEGEGALSGRIPVVYSDGNISFNKGFLFSTPGKGGRVVIENTQALIGGIPMDTPEFVQLDLAREALKDFDYQWAKLELNTAGDTLFMNMELDGKPAKILPFEYQKEVGSFVRVDAKSPGSRFQGIKLNVNLKLPFNQVLKFGNRLNSILN